MTEKRRKGNGMTIEEAIRILHPDTTKEAIREIEANGGDGIKAVEEACLMACEAMEKQVKKKPIAIETDFYGNSYECPVCGLDMGHYEFNYCDNCGQKLKWEE